MIPQWSEIVRIAPLVVVVLSIVGVTTWGVLKIIDFTLDRFGSDE